MTHMKYFCLLPLFILLSVPVIGTMPTKATAAIGPEYYAYFYLEATFGQSQGVLVSEPRQEGYDMIIDLVVNQAKRRSALATLVRTTMFAENVKIRIVDWNGNIEPPQDVSGPINNQLIQVQSLLMMALNGNPYFNSLSTTMIPTPIVYTVVNPVLRQITTHDMSEVHGRNTYTIESLFEECMHIAVGDVSLQVSTVFIQ
ncbi:hypothetical protein JXQ70_07685 [bacterium]|nr:hypothetical protein [bacterium]